MKRVSAVEFDDKLLLKVEHQVKGLVSGVSVFLVHDDGLVQEISPGYLSIEDDKKVASRDYDRVATPEEVEMTHQILVTRDEYMLNRTVKTLNAFGGTQLLRLIEMGGRYFAYSTHDNLLYTRIAEVVLTPDELPLDFQEVPLEYLPLLAENISDVAMQEDPKKGMTIQFGEGLFLRLKRFMKNIYVTIIQLDGEGKEGKLKAPLAFVLTHRKGNWVHVQEDAHTIQQEKLEKEMEKALHHVFNELSLFSMKK